MSPDWISAFANIFAAIGTVGALFVGGVLLKKEICRDKRHVDEINKREPSSVYACIQTLVAQVPDEARSKAVAVFMSPPERSTDDGRLTFAEVSVDPIRSVDAVSEVAHSDKLFCFRLDVVNNSSGPIFEVYVEVVALFVPARIGPQTRHAAPDRFIVDRLPTKMLMYLPLVPVERFSIWYSMYCDPGEQPIPIDTLVAIAFTDCLGLRWQRDRSGEVQRIGSNENPGWTRGRDWTFGVVAGDRPEYQ